MAPAAAPLAWADVAEVLESIGFDGAHVVRAVDDGAYSSAARWLVEDAFGERVFVKAAAASNEYAVRELVAQCATYMRAELAEVVPQLQGWNDGGDGRPAVLVLEDLSAARWGVPVTDADARALRTALDLLAGVRAFDDDPPFADAAELARSSPWEPITRDPTAAIATGLVDADWCSTAVPTLAAAAATVDVTGTQLVHGDLWRQNWCIAERGAVLVDFGATRGSARVNHAWGEGAVRAAGGPAGVVLGPSDPHHDAWAAWMAGLALELHVGSAARHAARPRLLETERREAIATLRWASAVLELPEPPIRAEIEPPGPWRP